MHSHTQCVFCHKTNVASKKTHSVLFTACWDPTDCTADLEMKIASGTREPRSRTPATATCDREHVGRAGTGIQGVLRDFSLAE